MEANLNNNSEVPIVASDPVFIINFLGIQLGISVLWVIIEPIKTTFLICGFLISLLFFTSKMWNEEIKFEKHMTPIVVVSFLSQLSWFLLIKFYFCYKKINCESLIGLTAIIGGAILVYHNSNIAKNYIAKNGLEKIIISIILFVMHFILFHIGLLIIYF